MTDPDTRREQTALYWRWNIITGAATLALLAMAARLMGWVG